MKITKILFLLLCALLLLTSCKTKEPTGGSGKASASAVSESGSGKPPGKVSLPIAVNDTLNPYSAKSKMNQELTQLMFDSLIVLDENYTPRYILAESVTRNGKLLTIKLKNAVFSDGSRVTAEDVTYSITAAQKSSTSKYKAQLAGITGKNAASGDTLTISISKPDEYYINLLDFPVIKMNSDNLRDDDKQLIPPVGSGRYIFDKTAAALKINPAYSFEKPNIEQISLVSTPDEDALNHNITTGSISIYYTDLSDGVLPSMNGAVSTAPLNNLIFLGANTKTGVMKSAEIRRAVSAALDRSAIAKKAYLTYAYPAAGPFHPRFAPGSPEENPLPEKSNLNLSVAELEKAGYNSKDTDGYYKNTAGKRLSLKLIVNKENTARLSAAELISDQLAKAGIELKITGLSFSDYEKAITAASFDLFLGEMRFFNNMDLSPLILQGAAASYFPSSPTVSGSSSATGSSSGSSSGGSSGSSSSGSSGSFSGAGSSSGSSAGSSGSSSAAGSSGSSGSSSAISSNAQTEAAVPSSAEIYAKLVNGEGTVKDFVGAFNNELPVIPLCYRSGVIASHLIFKEKLTPGAGSIFADFGKLTLK